MPLPEQVNGRIDEEFQEVGGGHAAHHGGGDAFGHFGAGAGGPHDGQQAQQVGQDGHVLGAHPHDRPVFDGVMQVRFGVEAAFGLPAVVGDIQVEEHQDPGLGVQAGQGQHAHDHADAEVVAQEIEQPDGPQQGKGHRQHDDAHLDEGRVFR